MVLLSLANPTCQDPTALGQIVKVKCKRHRTTKDKLLEELTAELSAEIVPGLGSSRRLSGACRGAANSLPSFKHIFSCGVKGARTEGSIFGH